MPPEDRRCHLEERGGAVQGESPLPGLGDKAEVLLDEGRPRLLGERYGDRIEPNTSRDVSEELGGVEQGVRHGSPVEIN